MKINRIVFIVILMANGGNTASLRRAGIVHLPSLMVCITALLIVLGMEIFNKYTYNEKRVLLFNYYWQRKSCPSFYFFPVKKEAAEADLLSNNRLLTRILVTSPFKILVHKVCCSKKGLFAHS